MFSVDHTGAQWCYVDSAHYSSCQDLQPSVRFQHNPWSYQACATPQVSSYQCQEYSSGQVCKGYTCPSVGASASLCKCPVCPQPRGILGGKTREANDNTSVKFRKWYKTNKDLIFLSKIQGLFCLELANLKSFWVKVTYFGCEKSVRLDNSPHKTHTHTNNNIKQTSGLGFRDWTLAVKSRKYRF